MQTEQLASMLKEVCERSAPGERVLTIHLFGIRYAEELKGRFHQVAEASGVGKSYGVELSKGAKLAPHVELKS